MYVLLNKISQVNVTVDYVRKVMEEDRPYATVEVKDKYAYSDCLM